MGRGVRAASNTSIEINFRYKGQRVYERIKLKPTKANLLYCERKLGQIENEIAHDTFDYSEHFPESKKSQKFAKYIGSHISVKQALMDYLEIAQSTTQPSTYNDYRKSVENILIPKWGHLKLTELKSKQIKKWLIDLKVSSKRAHNILIPLKTALNEAKTDGEILVNPLEGFRLKLPKTAINETVDPFNEGEIQLILKHCEGQIRNYIQFAFYTGLRTSELIALQWGDIDWNKGVVKVSKAKVLKQLKTTKTESGTREVLLFPEALEALHNQKQYTYMEQGTIFKDPNNKDWVDDKPIREKYWRPALRRAKVRYRYPYQTRHTYASMMLTVGENPAWAAQQMGHKDIRVFFQKYARFIPDNSPDAGMKFINRKKRGEMVGAKNDV